MGHAGGRHVEHGSPIGRIYRHTTTEMTARVVAVINERLSTVREVAEAQARTTSGRSTAAPRPFIADTGR
jgi:hypothetical protein